jgi:hypothetical protein
VSLLYVFTCMHGRFYPCVPVSFVCFFHGICFCLCLCVSECFCQFVSVLLWLTMHLFLHITPCAPGSFCLYLCLPTCLFVPVYIHLCPYVSLCISVCLWMGLHICFSGWMCVPFSIYLKIDMSVLIPSCLAISLCISSCIIQSRPVIMYCSVILFVRKCLFLFRRHISGIDSPCGGMLYIFRYIAAVIRYIGLLQSPFFHTLLYLPTLVSVKTLGVRCTDKLLI